MPKTANRAYSSHSKKAVALLGTLIREARIERGLTVQEVSERAGVSRGLLQRIEKGDMQCGIGVVFEVAVILGIRLFDTDEKGLGDWTNLTRLKLELLPKSVRKKPKDVHDDF